ncbi:hypothetical protein QBC32DRAFT_169721 [Pseudoneurospora amorphoporcata]|uniref:Uncharacterized protein n=1 Tax=Pseudoneurospora amorphoporcata TaxID=241081 RepID=A0AAN6SEC9_9PEZI|nr:hypothetical protein QBC32DRAFT_169721 [Pseudoneurospora amorphoporcata]
MKPTFPSSPCPVILSLATFFSFSLTLDTLFLISSLSFQLLEKVGHRRVFIYIPISSSGTKLHHHGGLLKSAAGHIF